MVLPEDSDNALVDVLQQIADSLDRNTDILNKIANHYDGVVPVMTRNAKRAEEMAEEQEKGFTQQVKDIFRPQEN
jgi:DNA anti-recombination protein RmuC